MPKSSPSFTLNPYVTERSVLRPAGDTIDGRPRYHRCPRTTTCSLNRRSTDTLRPEKGHSVSVREVLDAPKQSRAASLVVYCLATGPRLGLGTCCRREVGAEDVSLEIDFLNWLAVPVRMVAILLTETRD